MSNSGILYLIIWFLYFVNKKKHVVIPVEIIPVLDCEKRMAINMIIAEMTPKIWISILFLLIRKKQNGYPTDKHAAKPAGLSKLPIATSFPPSRLDILNNPKMACKIQTKTIQKTNASHLSVMHL